MCSHKKGEEMADYYCMLECGRLQWQGSRTGLGSASAPFTDTYFNARHARQGSATVLGILRCASTGIGQIGDGGLPFQMLSIPIRHLVSNRHRANVSQFACQTGMRDWLVLMWCPHARQRTLSFGVRGRSSLKNATSGRPILSAHAVLSPIWACECARGPTFTKS